MTIVSIQNGSITSPVGFSASAVSCGLKTQEKLDMALVVSEQDCSAAAVFTQNQVAAAPIVVSRQALESSGQRVRAVIINSGNANACTGERGLRTARSMQREVSSRIGCPQDRVLVMSTGVIGVPLPEDKVLPGIAQASKRLSRENGLAAAQAIMTTDIRPKTLAVTVELSGGEITIAGMAKGAGMIHPNMATMLGVIATDAAIPSAVLANDLLTTAVDLSFNRISVDGDTSTNDSVFLLANGAANSGLEPTDIPLIQAGINYVCTQLAKSIVRDGEGVTKLVEVRVSSCPNAADARRIANTIATSLLVKTAFAGSDPNWGRILAAAGRAGVSFDQYKTSLWAGHEHRELLLMRDGMAAAYAESDAAAIFALPEFYVHLDIGVGAYGASVWTGDLTQSYVSINADYRT